MNTNPNPTTGGSIVRDPDSQNGLYSSGTQVRITATPNSGFVFFGWGGDASGTTNPLTVTMNSNKTITANFVASGYTLTANVNPTGGGTVKKDPDLSSYSAGARVSITATALTGYTFLNWTGDVADPNAATTTVTMNSNKSVTANFTAVTGPRITAITPNEGIPGNTVSVTISGTGFSPGRTDILVSGSGVDVSYGQQTSTSLRADFYIQRRMPQSTRTVTVRTQDGTSNGLSFLVGTSDPSLRYFTLGDEGARSWLTSGAVSNVTTGYAKVEGNRNGTPTGIAVFTYSRNGVVVSEASVPGVATVDSGRIYAEVGNRIDTGIAIVNPNNRTVVVSYYFTDAAGNDFGTGDITIQPNSQIAQFLSERPFSARAFQGTFSFRSPQPVAVTALRGLTNERGDFLITTLPVSGLSSFGDLIFPHFADGDGWTSQVLLVNPSDNT